MVSCDSALYDKVVPAKLEKFKQSSLPSNLDPKEVSKVYTEKFANEDGPGRQYYNAIKEQAERNICPICGIRMVKTLDHYLPKSKFPTLSVTPSIMLCPIDIDCDVDNFRYRMMIMHFRFPPFPQPAVNTRITAYAICGYIRSSIPCPPQRRLACCC